MKKSPNYLSKKSRVFVNTILRDFQLETHHEKLLLQAAECLDRIDQAREEILRDGLTVPTRDGGIKAHPCVNIERDCKILFSRLIRELGLDVESTDEYTRLPRQYGSPVRR